jgi:hypothetical protein
VPPEDDGTYSRRIGLGQSKRVDHDGRLLSAAYETLNDHRCPPTQKGGRGLSPLEIRFEATRAGRVSKRLIPSRRFAKDTSGISGLLVIEVDGQIGWIASVKSIYNEVWAITECGAC